MGFRSFRTSSFFGPNGSAQIVRWRWAGESCQFVVDPRGICSSNGNQWNPMVQLSAMMRSYSIISDIQKNPMLGILRFPFLYGWSVNRTWDPKLEAQHL